jgi:hypothetical protein
MKNKNDDPHYQGLFWCHVNKKFYRWNEFMQISRRIDKGERI